jgi:hypothetical protein
MKRKKKSWRATIGTSDKQYVHLSVNSVWPISISLSLEPRRASSPSRFSGSGGRGERDKKEEKRGSGRYRRRGSGGKGDRTHAPLVIHCATWLLPLSVSSPHLQCVANCRYKHACSRTSVTHVLGLPRASGASAIKP